ncbi:MAG: hypothetical protein Q8P81_02245 [Nanoarchaeota archaeon]|nr:hypothetical protein [Nanoarchaeota archaeon]
MSVYKEFTKNDKFLSRIKTYPNVSFLISDRKVYFNKKDYVSGAFVNNVGHHDVGYLSLYQENVDRPSNSLIYPYVTKDGTLTAFKTISTSDFNSDFGYGDIISSSYPLAATISVDKYDTNSDRLSIDALKNTLNYYRAISPNYAYDDKETQKLTLISIPSIFYGSSIKKGSIDLQFHISGTLIGRLQDIKQNGDLIQTLPVGSNGSGSVGGVCLYNEGFMILTGAWNLTTEFTEVYDAASPATYPRWYYFASTGSSGAGENIPSSSFSMDFQGINYINTLTLMCHANKGEMNFSNNPTWRNFSQSLTPQTSSYTFQEPTNVTIKNISKSPFEGASGSFEKTVWINKIAIYDENKRVIAVAKMSKPIRKKEGENITFKIKTDLV